MQVNAIGASPIARYWVPGLEHSTFIRSVAIRLGHERLKLKIVDGSGRLIGGLRNVMRRIPRSDQSTVSWAKLGIVVFLEAWSAFGGVGPSCLLTLRRRARR